MDKTRNTAMAICLGIVAGFLPLLVLGKAYSNHLQENPWFLNQDTSYDFFLYWKGQGLILISLILMLIGTYYVISHKGTVAIKTSRDRQVLCLILIYLLGVLGSVLRSAYKRESIRGGYEQWEGGIILLCYGILVFMGYFFIRNRASMVIFLRTTVAGAWILSLIGVLQFMGLDLFRGKLGQWFMNVTLPTPLHFSFNFGLGRVYATLYNPNYIGSYVAVLLPLFLYEMFQEAQKEKGTMLNQLFSVLAASGMSFLAIMLVGSQSLTGAVAVILELLVLSGKFLYDRRKHKKEIAMYTGVLVIVGCVLLGSQFPRVRSGLTKLFVVKPNYGFIEQMYSKDNTLYMELENGKSCTLQTSKETEAGEGMVTLVGKTEGRTIFQTKIQRNQEYITPADTFERMHIRWTVNNELKIQTKYSREYKVIMPEAKEGFRCKNGMARVAHLRKIPKAGFKRSQKAFSRRGYIWSRTIPLLKNYLILGAGPDQFVRIFPNDDYVGKVNNGFSGQIITKPHNLFLQIWCQTGLISLLAYLALWILALKSGMERIRRQTEKAEKYREFLLVLALTGYQIAGLINDSIICVAPIYWILVGICLGKEDIQHDEP